MIYSNDIIITQLEDTFEGFSFQYSEVEYKGNIPVFFIRVNCNEETFAHQWSAIVDYIGVHFQTSLMDEFAVWNLYLFFIVQNEISNSLKYQIENNTFSSRKILIERETSNQDIINDHIINSDLQFGNTHLENNTFEHNSVIWKYVKEKEAKRKITEEDRTAFRKITATIKN